MSQKERKPNEFTIGYKAMVTDYLLYEDCCDYHLKLILAVWDGVTVKEEVKYFSYLTTWGSSQFRDLCVDFGLLACARSVYCDLNRLLGAYCIVLYYPKKQQIPEDKIDEVMPVVSNCDRENDWDHLQFAEPFARIAVAEEKAESTIPLAKYVDDIEETYWFCVNHLWLHPNIRVSIERICRSFQFPDIRNMTRNGSQCGKGIFQSIICMFRSRNMTCEWSMMRNHTM